jgi:hypothetical protein
MAAGYRERRAASLNASVLGAILEQIENDQFSFWVKKTLAAEDGIYG